MNNIEQIMKRNLWKCALVGGPLLAAAITVAAGPLQRGDVPNDPVFVIHVDCDTLRQSVIGKYLMEEMEKPEAKKKIAAFQTIFSFDPRKELHGLTVYGPTTDQEDGVLLVYADFDAARLTTLAEGAKKHESVTHGRHVIHSWIDENKPSKKSANSRTYSAIHGKVVIFAQKESRVADALDVLDRTKPNLTGSTKYASLGAGEQGTFIQGAATKIVGPPSDPNAAVLKQAKMFLLNIGESQQRIYASLNLETDSEEVAKQIESVARGLVGLMALQKDKPESTKLAQGLTIQQAGSSIVAKLSLPAEDVVGMMKSSAAKKKAKD